MGFATSLNVWWGGGGGRIPGHQSCRTVAFSCHILNLAIREAVKWRHLLPTDE